MTDHIELDAETDEQKLTRIRGIRAARALQDAPGLLLHIRALATSGKTERGETLAEWSAPLRITAIDHSDEIYAQLINWVGSWSEALQIAPPSTTVVAWANFREVQGFRAHTTPEGAQILARLQTMWLAIHAEQINAHPDAAVYQADVLDFIGKARGRYPMAPRRPRDVYPRQCPLCEEHAVGAEWASADVLDVTVSCDHCGHELEAGTPARLLDLVLWAEIPCECRYPGDPKAMCATHPQPISVTVSVELERGLRDPEMEETDGTRA